MSGIYHENKLWANVSGPNVAGTTPSENLSTLTIDGVTYDTTELVFCYDDNGSLYTDSTKATAVTGYDSKLYIATNTGKQYRYNGSTFSALGVNAINDLSDVTITSASDGQALEYDATAGKWKNVAKKAADTPTFSEASTRANLSGSGETMATILGKIKKWYSDLKTVAFSGSYNDLSNKPTIPAAQVNSDWNASSGVAQILHKPTLATVATSGSYNDLSNKPTIPTVNNGTLIIQKNGTQVQTFSANQSENATANITVPEVEETDTTNSTPYLYRASQNSGDRCYLRQLVGASFVANQLNNAGKSIKNGQYTDTRNYFDLNLRRTNSPYTELYRTSLSSAKTISTIISSSDTFAGFSLIHNGSNRNLVLMSNSNDYIVSGHKYFIFMQVVSANPTTVDGIDIENFNFIDLTQMFGTAIADKAYTMEQTTAGSGIAWLKSYGFFTESYYPYSTGSLQSVNTSGKVCCGKNLTYLAGIGIYNTTTGEVELTTPNTYAYTPKIPSKNISYTVSCELGMVQVLLYKWDINGNYLGWTILYNSTEINEYTFTVSDCYWFALVVRKSGSNVSDVSVFKSFQLEAGTQATEYEPYTTHTTPISPIDLRGVPKLVDNNIVYDGDVMDESGTVTRKYAEINLDNMASSIEFNSGYNCWVITVSIAPKSYGSDGIPNMMSNAGYIPASYGSDKSNNKMGVDLWGHLFVGNNSSSTKPTGKIVYEIATPTTEQTNPIQNPEIYNQFGWEQFIDDRSFPIPVGHNSEYVNLPDWMTQGYYGDFRDRVDSLVYDKVWKLVGVFSHEQTPNIPKDCNELLLMSVSENGTEYYDGQVYPYALYGVKFLYARPLNASYVCVLKPDGAVIAGGTYKLAIFYR